MKIVHWAGSVSQPFQNHLNSIDDLVLSLNKALFYLLEVLVISGYLYYS